MAHVLLGWELGGNRGHGVSVMQAGDALRARGHRVSYALQRVDAISPAEARGSPVWPAPVTPRLILSAGQRSISDPSTLGDILARLGFNDVSIVESMLRAWRLLLDTIRPDVVVSDFGPYLLLAARGRCPAVAKGTGFSTPPRKMDAFPSLTGRPPRVPEAELLATVNQSLDRIGAKPIDRLPQLFTCQHAVVGTLRELDPYAEWRKGPLAMPAIGSAAPPIATGTGKEVFVYGSETIRVDSRLWEALERSRLPVRVYVPGVPENYRAELRRRGFAVKTEAVPWPLIVERSRLVVSHGGHGFVCSAMMAGLPQLICFQDLEKRINGTAVANAGLGAAFPLGQVEADALTETILSLYESREIADRARAAAPDFQTRYDRTMPEAVANAVEALVGRVERVKGIEPSS